ncbi:MAG: hypothetical protein ACP5I7_03760 [Sulfolobales archaeon]|jgi:hypothetical protein
MSQEKMSILKIYLENFDDMAIYMISRATGFATLVAVMCTTENCFTIMPLGERSYVHILSPPPEKEKACKYYYIDDQGSLTCSQRPAPARTNLIIVKVKEFREILTP